MSQGDRDMLTVLAFYTVPPAVAAWLTYQALKRLLEF